MCVYIYTVYIFLLFFIPDRLLLVLQASCLCSMSSTEAQFQHQRQQGRLPINSQWPENEKLQQIDSGGCQVVTGDDQDARDLFLQDDAGPFLAWFLWCSAGFVLFVFYCRVEHVFLLFLDFEASLRFSMSRPIDDFVLQIAVHLITSSLMQPWGPQVSIGHHSNIPRSFCIYCCAWPAWDAMRRYPKYIYIYLGFNIYHIAL